MFRSVVAGASAILLLAGPALACTPIESATLKLTACVDALWQPEQGVGVQEFSYRTEDGRFGMLLVTEKAAFPIAQFREAILANAVKGAGGKQEDVKIIGERVENINDKPFNVIEYTLANGGDPVLFQNYYYSQLGFGSLQILVFSVTSDATTAAFRVGQLAGTVKIGE